jgi:hypothetical protein
LENTPLAPLEGGTSLPGMQGQAQEVHLFLNPGISEFQNPGIPEFQNPRIPEFQNPGIPESVFNFRIGTQRGNRISLLNFIHFQATYTGVFGTS